MSAKARTILSVTILTLAIANMIAAFSTDSRLFPALGFVIGILSIPWWLYIIRTGSKEDQRRRAAVDARIRNITTRAARGDK